MISRSASNFLLRDLGSAPRNLLRVFSMVACQRNSCHCASGFSSSAIVSLMKRKRALQYLLYLQHDLDQLNLVALHQQATEIV
jgi:hypothetical protein